MTREQLIILGLIAAAFVVGWLAHALTGLTGSRQTRDEPASAGLEAPLERALESRRELDAAIRAYEETVGQPPVPWRSPPGGMLEQGVIDALRSDAANDSMLGAVSADRAALDPLEQDLTDWGFAYGVAWARVRDRRPGEGDDAIAGEALAVAEAVFRAYTQGADWTQALEERQNGRRPLHPLG